jgi:L-alanine-DL-glutamate epimerase-like enolase superfamily enzyme
MSNRIAIDRPFAADRAGPLAYNANPVLRDPFELDHGRLVVPDRPGSGIEWDEGEIRKLCDP